MLNSQNSGFGIKPTKAYFEFPMNGTKNMNGYEMGDLWTNELNWFFASIASGPQKRQKFYLVERIWSNTFEREVKRHKGL